MSKATAISLAQGFDSLTFAANRKPDSTDIQRAVCTLSEFRDGGVYLAHFAGVSAWERHPAGDELVMVCEGETALSLILNGEEVIRELKAGELIVVPAGTWHRFNSAGVKLMAVTPQPSDHQVEKPES
ncbi:MAG: cupin domain-containing protein [Pseudomonadota bacterium]